MTAMWYEQSGDQIIRFERDCGLTILQPVRGWQRPMIWDIAVRTVDTRTDILYARLNFPPVYPVKFQISRYSKLAGRFVRIHGLQIGENRPKIGLIWLLTNWHKFRIVARSSQFVLLQSLPERLFFLPGVQMPSCSRLWRTPNTAYPAWSRIWLCPRIPGRLDLNSLNITGNIEFNSPKVVIA